ncbi:MAG: PilZ domain-containing protein [Candidatus Omnitrophica bacterium]|nr:PilZ domain-containing protein [Candidatus Omnitrophota bacterium]
MLENRRHLRIRQLMDVTWNMPGEDLAGQGQIINISASGIFLQIDSSFRPLDKCVLSIDPEISQEKPPFLTKKGRVVWFRKIQSPHYSYQCGLEFLKEHIFDQTLSDWLETKTTQLAQTMNVNILNNYVA